MAHQGKYRRKTGRWRSVVTLLSERRHIDSTLSNSTFILLAVLNYRRDRAAYISHMDRSINISTNQLILNFSNLTEQDCLAFFDLPKTLKDIISETSAQLSSNLQE